MSEQDFLDGLAAFLSERTGLQPSELQLDTDLVASRIMDSFLVIELFFHMEQLLGRALQVEGFDLKSIGTPRRIFERYVNFSEEVRV